MPEEARHSDLLRVESLFTGYGKKQILNGVSMTVAAGEVVALIGHNGAGKSTLLKAIFGLLPIWQGRIIFDGEVLPDPAPQHMLKAGLTYVPQGNRVFTDMTVKENLEMGGVLLDTKAALHSSIERAFELFPLLRRRSIQRAGTLSGGEKQTLALANALILSPKMLLLDEPSLGLAPPLASQAFEFIRQTSSDLGIAILIVEQKVREVLKIANRLYVLRTGQVTYTGTTDALTDDTKLRDVFL